MPTPEGFEQPAAAENGEVGGQETMLGACGLEEKKEVKRGSGELQGEASFRARTNIVPKLVVCQGPVSQDKDSPSAWRERQSVLERRQLRPGNVQSMNSPPRAVAGGGDGGAIEGRFFTPACSARTVNDERVMDLLSAEFIGLREAQDRTEANLQRDLAAIDKKLEALVNNVSSMAASAFCCPAGRKSPKTIDEIWAPAQEGTTAFPQEKTHPLEKPSPLEPVPGDDVDAERVLQRSHSNEVLPVWTKEANGVSDHFGRFGDRHSRQDLRTSPTGLPSRGSVADKVFYADQKACARQPPTASSHKELLVPCPHCEHDFARPGSRCTDCNKAFNVNGVEEKAHWCDRCAYMKCEECFKEALEHTAEMRGCTVEQLMHLQMYTGDVEELDYLRSPSAPSAAVQIEVREVEELCYHKNSARSKQSRCEHIFHLGRFVRDPRFDLFISAVVMVNSFLVGLQVDWEARQRGTNSGFTVLEYCCSTIFTLELLVRVIGTGSEMVQWETLHWTMLDVTLVCASWVAAVMSLWDGGMKGASGTASMGKILKIFRMARIMRIIRMVRFLSQVRLMVQLIIGSLSSLFWLFVLVIGLMYVFAIVLTSSLADWVNNGPDGDNPQLDHPSYEKVKKYFGDLPQSIYTLFLTLTNGIGWGEVADHILEAVGPVYFFFFIFYVFFTFFSVLNIVTGVFVDGAIQSANGDRSLRMMKEQEQQKSTVQDLVHLLERLDLDSSGMISLEEWEKALDDEQVLTYLAMMKIDTRHSRALFELLDRDCSGEVSITEFVDGMRRYRGGAQALELHKVLSCVEVIRENSNRMLGHFDIPYVKGLYPTLIKTLSQQGADSDHQQEQQPRQQPGATQPGASEEYFDELERAAIKRSPSNGKLSSDPA